LASDRAKAHDDLDPSRVGAAESNQLVSADEQVRMEGGAFRRPTLRRGLGGDGDNDDDEQLMAEQVRLVPPRLRRASSS
jgi:hypothetical protein